MKLYRLFLISILILSSIQGYSQNSALTTDKGHVSFGLVQDLKWGVTDNIELSTHPILDILCPNLGVKVLWFESPGLFFSTEHEVNYPTPLLKTISKDGIGGIIGHDISIPEIIGFNNYILGTYITSRHTISLKTGIKLAINPSGDKFETIDYPLFYGNTAVFHTGYISDSVISYNVDILSWLNAYVDVQLLLFPEPFNSYELRQNTYAQFVLGKRVSINAGYVLVTGEYPYGEDLKILPSLDIIFSF